MHLLDSCYIFVRLSQNPIQTILNDFMNKTGQLPVSPARATLMYISVALFLFFEMAVQVSPSVMASQLMHDLGITAFGLGLMSGIYFYSYTFMQIPSGFLLDAYNPRIVIVSSILICALGALFFSISTNIILGSFARFFMGAGSAFAFVSVLVVTADLFEAKYFAVITGITQALAALGAMAGQMPISYLVVKLGWHKTMIVLSMLGILIAIIVLLLLTYQRDSRCLKSVCPHYQTHGKLSSILKSSQTWYVALYACLLWAPMSGFASLWGVPFLEQVFNLHAHSAALYCSMMWLGLAIFSPILGLISNKLNNRKLPLFASALIGTLAFAGILFFHLPIFILISVLFVAGAACSGQALSFTVVKENNSVNNRATALAINNMAVVISGAIFQPLIGKLIDWCHHLGTGHCYQTGLIAILICYFLAALIALLIRDSNETRLVT